MCVKSSKFTGKFTDNDYFSDINLIRQAVILCGGKGERLRPLTNIKPKPLVEINKKPILTYILNHLSSYGIKDLIICTGYKSYEIDRFFETNIFDFNLNLINSGDVDIIDRIKSVSTLLQNDFLLLYGDTISDINLNDLINLY